MPRYTVNCSMVFADLPQARRAAAARAAGFDAVEFWWPFAESVPADSEVDSFVRSIHDAGVTLTALNFAGGDMAAGERGLVSDPRRSGEFLDAVDVAFGIAERLGTKAFNALYGNRVPDSDPHSQDDVALENLARVGAAAERRGAVLLIEPLSGVDAYPLRTAADAIRVIDRVRAETGTGALRLLADLYHLTVNGDDVATVIDEHVTQIGHVQIADVPGRGQPGTGHVDFGAHLAHLADSGYDGLVGLEYHPGPGDRFTWLKGA